jgi:predicted Zn-dependent peptidase
LEQPSQLLNYATLVKIYGFPADYWDSYPAKISAVTADDVQRVAKKYFDPAVMQVVAVGDAGKIKAVLEKFGPVEVYDADGKPVATKAPTGGGSEQ